MSCLFNSFSTFKSIVKGDDSFTIRQKICDYLATNPILFDDIKSDTIIEWETNTNLESYIKHMRNTSTWGGAIEIKCFCEIYDCNVEVMNIRNEGFITMISRNILFQKSGTESKEVPLVRISWNGGHYEPL
jgi:hypothetical protein